jgi:phosphohistidine phosphatase
VCLVTRLLVLLRHAKAETGLGGTDFDRPLTSRGEHDSHAAGRWLRTQGYLPDLVICSAARRARQTWRHTAAGLGVTPEVRYQREVYEAAHPDDLLNLLRAAPPATGVLVVVGHNPTLEMLSAGLDPDGGPAGGLRTAGIAVHAVGQDWVGLESGAAPLTDNHLAR